MTTPAGIDHDNLVRWFDRQVGGLVAGSDGRLDFELITGGRSNLTFRVSDGPGRRWVLRRPPMGHVLDTAHDMSRAHRIISALADSGVPVPAVVGLCQDEAVNGAPFYVMDFVPGVVVRTIEEATGIPVHARRRMGESLVEVLARLHAVDLDAVGLADLGRHEGYIERQLKRWRRQFVDATTREVPGVLETHEILAARVPAQQGVAIVHGDYRLDNCMMDPAGPVAAVLDWELCTLGDVLADVAGMVAYGDERTTGGAPPPTAAEGFPSTNEVRELYARHGTRDLDELDFYVAFAYWRIACIVEGVYSRYAAGVMGDQDDPQLVELFGRRVLDLASLAHDMARELPRAA